MLIVYGATAGVSVVQRYAGAFFPGLILADLYVVYVVLVALVKPHLAPPLSAEQRHVVLPPLTQQVAGAGSNRALPALLKALRGSAAVGVPAAYLLRQLAVTLLPAVVFAVVALGSYRLAAAPADVVSASTAGADGVSEPPGTLKEPAGSGGGLQEPPAADGGVKEPPGAEPAAPAPALQGPPPHGTCRNRARGPPASAGPLLGGPGHWRAGLAGLLRLAELPAARDLQDATDLVLPAGGADPGGAGVHRVRPGHAHRGPRPWGPQEA